MRYNQMANAKQYLCRFDQILDQMAKQMLTAQPICNIAIFFIRCMIPHHQAAIYMCENLLQYCIAPRLKSIAENIIRTQTAGIKQMEEIAKTTVGFNSSRNQVCCYNEKYRDITQNMINRMKNSPRCVNISLNFTNEMIPHHEGAIAMCENLLQYCIDPRLKTVAENIIREQSKGVQELEQVRRCLCN